MKSLSDGEVLASDILLKTISNYFIKFLIFISLITMITWIFLIYDGVIEEDYSFAINRLISLIVVSCPCAFGLAVPSVVSIILQTGIKYGILLKKNTIFNRLNKINCVVFDKTGTLIS